MTNSPSIDCFIWFMGDRSKPIDKAAIEGYKEIKQAITGKKNFHIITMTEMEKTLDNFHPFKLAFMFNLKELQTTMKPYAFQYTFKKFGADAVIYLDSDIWVTGSLEDIQRHLVHRSCVVTPYYSNPVPEDGKKQQDKDILASGAFNFGFVSFSKTPTATKFLEWWAERVSLYGFGVESRHMFYDQNWGIFIPSFFDHEEYYVLRDFRYNIAYWNLHERGAAIHMKSGIPYIENSVTKEDEQIVFMHFAGMSLLEKYDMDGISKHQNRFSLLDFPRLQPVFDKYLDLVAKHNTIHYHQIPYGYNNFTDGSEIDPWMREIYAAAVYPTRQDEFERDDNPPYQTSLSPFLRLKFKEEVLDDPFCSTLKCHSDTNKVNFMDWMWDGLADKAVDAKGAFYHNIIERKVWRSRSDLMAAFPYPFEKSFIQWRQWFMNNAVSDGAIEEGTFNKWKSKVDFHVSNHWRYHHKVKRVTDNVGLNIIGWHSGQFSIGISGAKLIRSAIKVGIDVNAIELDMPPDHHFTLPEKLDFQLSRSIAHPINFVIVNAAEFIYPLNGIPGVIWDHKYNIGYWAWELDTFHTEWIALMKKVDEVWCPSTFVQNAIKNTEGYKLNPIPVRVLPIPHEPKEIAPKKGEQKSKLLYEIFDEHKKTKPFVFLVAFDYHSFVERKNPIASIKAFLDAFPAEEDKEKKYQLIVKSHFGTTADIDEMKVVANHDSRVIFLNELLSNSDNKKLYRHQDCFLTLHRTEGYGMIILETLSNGIPVIGTNYSGNVDFFSAIPQYHDKCVFPVSYKLIDIEEDFGPYKKGNHWADPDHNSAVKAMRKVVTTNCKKTIGSEMSKEMLSKFGSEAVGEKLEEMVRDALPKVIKKQRKTIQFLKAIQGDS